jgi:hypothetical protein
VIKSKSTPALLTRTEIEWLLNNINISKAYEYRIKSDIKKKLKTFTEQEIPLLLKKGIIDNHDLSISTQNLRTNPQIDNQNLSVNSLTIENCAQKEWAGRDLNPRTPPCQGGILTKLDHRPGPLLMTIVDSALQDLDAIYIAINQGHNINHTYNIKIKNYLPAHRLKTVI